LDPKIQKAILLSPYVFGAAFVCLFLMILFRKTTEKIAQYSTGLAPAKIRPILEKLVSTFLKGLHILKNPKETLLVLMASIAAWTCEFSCFYIVAIGYHLSPPITFFTAALVMAIVNLAILIPSTPGGIGIFEFVGMAILTPLGIPKESATGYMLLVHLVVLIPITLWGMYYFFREGLSFSKLEKEQEATQK
jgi:uncharacterized protein (TIRG00374 family)